MWSLPRTVKRAAVIALTPAPAAAHVSDGALILLLPTDVYVAAGVWAVGLTFALLALTPARWRPPVLTIAISPPAWADRGAAAVSLASAGAFLALCVIGIAGARDPLANPLPLAIWTVWWVALVLAQGVFGDIWRWLNPWSGLRRLFAGAPVARLPERLGAWPAVGLFLAFAIFALADPAPDDPARLATIAFGYWALTLAGVIVFGETYAARCDFVTVLMRLVAGLSPLKRERAALRIGPPGWRLAQGRRSTAIAAMALVFLGVGSFDGLNETFWWLARIGVNPLEHPGRSAIVAQTVGGLLAAVAALAAVFAGCVALGVKLAGSDMTAGDAFRHFAPTALPIAFAYHFAHYLVVLMVNGQYALAAATDPLTRGDDWLGLGTVYVTTGFLNTTASVERIFQAQAGAVVLGHAISIALAHAKATTLFGDRRRAALSQLPLAAFMLAYTFLGLWLLAAPKGG